MAKGFAQVIVVIKAILTRVIFATHGLVAIWRVTQIKNDPYYWYLCASILALMFEGVFTLTIKKNQEWKWFCPSVFFYLCSVVPAIWLLEVDKFDKKLLLKLAEKHNQTAINKDKLPPEVFTAIENLNLGVQLDILKDLDEETWATVIEQLLMLILIIGRWMLPKGGLTRDQLSQLLLVYIGTAADIIEFFDSFKDDKIASRRILCLLILSIWSWSLLQFTFVLTATKSRRTRITADIDPPKPKFVNGIYKVKEVCCSIDVWGILINIILQDAPFLIFRMLLITYYKIISYMNIFFTCKNTLVIILQFYRLYVVQQEKNKEISKMAKATVSGNLAKAVERAAFMGPTADPKIKAGRNVASAAAASGKKAGASNTKKGQQSSSGGQPKKHRSQDSITSQAQTNNRVLEAARRERAKTGRRKSLSTSNLPTGIEEAFIPPQTDRVEEDDLEMAMSGSVLSGTNDSQEEEESDVPLDEISFTSERPTRKNRKIRMSENPGIYKISGSRSSETSSHQGHGRCRQDTGYSSSSRDSANSSRRGRIVNGGSRTGRAAPSNANRSRTRNAVQR
ncbi:transmembrane protein 26-like isoform X2 [Folsomia candida]|nr:transmembrane protein 26-like isoform X2 [Folsomia candida]